LVGINSTSSIIIDGYWDIDSSSISTGVGKGSSIGTTWLYTLQITGTSAEENMPEFDWVNIWKTTSGYPILRWQE